ncbi:cdc42 effector protein 3 [Trichomycterus rosablanca]|uniref:cdc42 effector protein 3 n=1 Tax=Trichomycterus rosablanca TaxID=2290929 RepID=UPI002F3547B9
MPAKTPIYLKSNNSKKGKKCRLRDILSPDMISPPLGDFRHTVHIGKECDTFGDMSFLQGKFELLPGKGGMIRPQHGTHGEFMRANSASDASYIEAPSPILKNAISLPSIGGSQALTLPLISTTVYPVTRDPFDDLSGLSTPSVSSEGRDDLDILQMENLLKSITMFRRDPSPILEEGEKSLFLVDQVEKSPAKKNFKYSSMNNTENESDKPLKSLYVNGKHNENDNSNVTANCKNNISCNNDYNSINDDFFQCEKEFGGNGDLADRDSGVEEGRISDFDFELSKSKSVSHQSLSQISGSLLSLELDLGPSILDDILNIMGKPEH